MKSVEGICSVCTQPAYWYMQLNGGLSTRACDKHRDDFIDIYNNYFGYNCELPKVFKENNEKDV